MGLCDADTARKSRAFPVLMQENNLFRKCLCSEICKIAFIAQQKDDPHLKLHAFVLPETSKNPYRKCLAVTWWIGRAKIDTLVGTVAYFAQVNMWKRSAPRRG